MRATIDKAGRLVIPRQLRDGIGLRPGEVDVTIDGSGLRIEPIAAHSLAECGGLLVIPAEGASVDDDVVQHLRDVGQR